VPVFRTAEGVPVLFGLLEAEDVQAVEQHLDLVPASTTAPSCLRGSDQSIRWAKFTMNPSGPRTDAMRQMSSN
jgi:hypothetical protein